jgi:hypothetical protein
VIVGLLVLRSHRSGGGILLATNALVSLVSFVQSTYSKSDWTMEEALDARRGFVSAVEQASASGTRSASLWTRLTCARPTAAG